MIAESVGTEKLEAMSRARWEGGDWRRIDRRSYARGNTSRGSTTPQPPRGRRARIVATTRHKRFGRRLEDRRTRASARRRTRDRDASMSIRTRTTRTRFPRMSRGDASNRRETYRRVRGRFGSLSLCTAGRWRVAAGDDADAPGPAPFATRASDVDDARWAHHAWRMATSRVVNAVVAAAAASDWRLDDAATEGEILDPDAKVSAAAREAARAAVAAVVDYDPEQFQDVVVKSGGNEPSTRDDAAANAAATTIQTGWRAGRARAAARRTERRARGGDDGAGGVERVANAKRRSVAAKDRGAGAGGGEDESAGEGESGGGGEGESGGEDAGGGGGEDESAGGGEGAGPRRVVRGCGDPIVLARMERQTPLRSRSRAAARFDDDNDDDFAGVEEAFYAPPANLDLDDVDLDFDLDLDATAGVASLASSSTLGEIFRDAATTEVATTATAEASASSSSSSRRGKEWAHLLPRASAEDWPMSRLASSSAESRGGDDSEVGSSARAMERKLEEAASDWGLRERGPAAEAFTATAPSSSNRNRGERNGRHSKIR